MAIKNISRTCLIVFCMVASFCAYGQKKQRIKQIWHHNPQSPSYTYIDSLVFYYSGNRGSVCNPHRFNGVDYAFPYDAAFRLSDYPATPLPYPLFDIHEPTVQYDSLYRYNFNNFQKNLIFTVFKATYERDTALVHSGAGFSPNGYTMETVMAYNPDGQLIAIYKMQYNSITYATDTIVTRHIQYDNKGKVSTDSTWSRRASENIYTSYTYNKQGLPETISQQRPLNSGIYHYVTTAYTYNAAGSVTKVLRQYLDEDVFIPLSKEIFEYNNANYLVSHTQYEGDTMIGYKREVSYDNNGNPYLHDIRYYTGGTLYSCELVEVFFNEYHNPDSAITWVNHCHQGLTQRNTTIYTYETYGTDNDTDSVAPKRRPFIYPNPARNIVHIRWHKDFSKQPLEIKLYNAAGQEMKRYTILKPAVTDDLNIQGLAAGVYLLRINMANNNEYVYSGKLVLL